MAAARVGARAGLAAAALAAAAAGCDGDPPPPPAADLGPRAVADPGIVRVAGSGAMTPFVTRLAEQYARAGGAPRVLVEPSVGSSGGIHAAADGAVDLGMTARPLGASELGLGLLVTKVARGAVVLAAHPGVAAAGVSSAELVDLYAGRRRAFEGGQRATVLLRDREESANDALEQLVPGLREAREEAYRSRRLRVLYHDDAMREALGMTPGALGVYDLEAIATDRLPLRVLRLDGVLASRETLADGRWRAARDLAFVARPDRLERARGFLSYVASAEGRRVIEESGCVPVDRSGPP